MIEDAQAGVKTLATSGRSADPLGSVDAEFEERWLGVGDGVELRVLHWWPRGAPDHGTLVFVAGWVSVVEGWLPVLRALVPTWPVLYIETREKRTARLDRRRMRVEQFTVERLAGDLIEAARLLAIDGRSAVWFGSSMGSNAILEALKRRRLEARAAFLVGPNAEFRVPLWGRPILHLPAWLYHPIKHFVFWYLRHFRVNARSEPEQMQRYVRTLRAAHPLRLKLSARAVLDYQVWPDLETIDVPVAIAYAASDTLHSEREVRQIVAAIPHGRTVECPTNQYMHDAPIVAEIDRFIAELGEAP
jgi:pimeloyl-ACP methyl ester carboxylesterase